MAMNGDAFGGYFMSTVLVSRIFNVLIYGWFNGVAATVLEMLVDEQELCDNKELARQFSLFEVTWRQVIIIESIPHLVSCSETAWLFSGLNGKASSR